MLRASWQVSEKCGFPHLTTAYMRSGASTLTKSQLRASRPTRLGYVFAALTLTER